MRRDIVDMLVCPDDRAALRLAVERAEGDDVVDGTLACPECGAAYPIRDSIPDLLPRGSVS